jgi:signal recognition particle subunit SRP54
MGSLKSLLGMIPGMGSKLKNVNIDDKQFVYIETMIGAMTKEERRNPDLVAKGYSRRIRIANGSGRSYGEVNGMVKKFEEMKRQMQSLAGMDEKQMEKISKGQASIPLQQPKIKKGKGKNKGGFRF